MCREALHRPQQCAPISAERIRNEVQVVWHHGCGVQQQPSLRVVPQQRIEHDCRGTRVREQRLAIRTTDGDQRRRDRSMHAQLMAAAGDVRVHACMVVSRREAFVGRRLDSKWEISQIGEHRGLEPAPTGGAQVQEPKCRSPSAGAQVQEPKCRSPSAGAQVQEPRSRAGARSHKSLDETPWSTCGSGLQPAMLLQLGQDFLKPLLKLLWERAPARSGSRPAEMLSEPVARFAGVNLKLRLGQPHMGTHASRSPP